MLYWQKSFPLVLFHFHFKATCFAGVLTHKGIRADAEIPKLLNLGTDHVSSDPEEVSWFQPVLSSPYMFSPEPSCAVIAVSTPREGLQRGALLSGVQ